MLCGFICSDDSSSSLPNSKHIINKTTTFVCYNVIDILSIFHSVGYDSLFRSVCIHFYFTDITERIDFGSIQSSLFIMSHKDMTTPNTRPKHFCHSVNRFLSSSQRSSKHTDNFEEQHFIHWHEIVNFNIDFELGIVHSAVEH